MTSQPAQAFASHLINQTLSSIALLESLSILNPVDASLIRQKLPSPTGPFPSLNPPAAPAPAPTAGSSSSPSSSFSHLNLGNPASTSPSWTVRHAQEEVVPAQQPQGQGLGQAPVLPPRGGGGRPGPQEIRAKALWDFNGTQPDDLQFRGGDMVIIDEEVNDQWYRGRVIPNGHNGPLPRSGLFPSNYVEKLPPPPTPQGSYYSAPPPPQTMVPYQQQQQGYYDQKPPQHMQMLAPPQQQPSQQGMVVQQDGHNKSKYGKLGSQLGNSAVMGLGFGAGSAVASEVVHAIF
ncbi:hypothetical protein CI109_100020 [Kwoniella shandongensis]|uniref:Uncharacterized protein n=1 Tax=Kwoniella shandongensis TaxID=1734106 RepID=A0A5M6BXG2_9TREE|nr:uncharacterized protein CI109_006007 [Kwoniella shandongensis]KAA5525699.1 hypothetical protein CI109_006007 [Kwoniella shandongensis]